MNLKNNNKFFLILLFLFVLFTSCQAKSKKFSFALYGYSAEGGKINAFYEDEITNINKIEIDIYGTNGKIREIYYIKNKETYKYESKETFYDLNKLVNEKKYEDYKIIQTFLDLRDKSNEDVKEKDENYKEYYNITILTFKKCNELKESECYYDKDENK